MQTDNNRKPSELVRGLGLWASTAVIVGGMVGQSIFLVSSQVARDLGSVGGVLAAWLIGGVTVLFASFCYAELGAALPYAGGEYIYLGRGLGPKWGFLFGWTSAWIQGPGMAATIAAGLLRITSFLLPSLNASLFTWSVPVPFETQTYHFTFTASQLWAALALAGMAAINYFGVRTAGQFQIVITGLKVAAIVLIIGLGFTVKQIGAMPPNATFSEHGGVGAMLSALVPIMLAYNGFQGLAQIGGEIRDPRRTIPRAAILGVLAVVILYFLINVVYFRVLGFSLVANSQNVASDAAVHLVGRIAARWLTLFMMLSALGSLHGSFLTRPRVPYAMARDGQFFTALQRVHPIFHTPSAAIVFHGSLAVFLVLTGTFEQIYSLEIFALWIFIALTAVALIRLRNKEPKLTRTYRAWGYPWTALIVAAVAFAMSANLWLLRPVRSSIGLAVILLGLLFFGQWGERRTDYQLDETAPSAKG